MHRKRIRDNLGGSNSLPQAIALSLTLPEESVPIRMRDQFTSKKTATANPIIRIPLHWPSPDQNQNVFLPLPKNQLAVFLFRDPHRSIIIDYKNPDQEFGRYEWKSRKTPSGYSKIFLVTPGVSEKLRPCCTIHDGGVQHHDTKQKIGEGNDENEYVWIDGAPDIGDQPAITLFTEKAMVIGERFSYVVYAYNAGQPYVYANESVTLVAAKVIGQQIGIQTINNSDYFRVEVSYETENDDPVFDANGMWVSVKSVCNGEIMRHFSIAGLDENSARVSALRALGLSLFIKNNTAEGYKAGSWIANQMGKGQYWDSVLAEDPDPFTYLSSKRGNKDLKLASGFYGFMKPAEESDMEYRIPYATTNSEVIIERTFPLDDEPFIVWVAQIPINNGGADVVNVAVVPDLLATVCWSLEYTTEDNWTVTDVAHATPEDWEMALMAISSMEQFYENPIHWAAIRASLGKYAGVASKILALFPQTAAFSPIASAISNALG